MTAVTKTAVTKTAATKKQATKTKVVKRATANKRATSKKRVAKKAPSKAKTPAKKTASKRPPKKNTTVKQGGAQKGAVKLHKGEVPEVSPFRSNSAYSVVFSILYAHKDKGITRKDLIREAARMTGKEERLVSYDASVVTSVKSPDEGGRAHPSVNRAADKYWVEKADGGNLKLHMR